MNVVFKRRRNLRQVSTTKMSESEPSDEASKHIRMTSEPKVGGLLRDESGGRSRF